MSTPVSFQSLITRIAPLQSELDEAKSHADSIRARLQSSFNLKKFVIVGSHSRETAIRRYSDVDHFAVFSRDEFRWGNEYKNSDTVLNNIKDDLAQRFTQTPVHRDGPAVVVSFGQGNHSVDVVPAMFWEVNKENWPIYYIPDGNGGWIPTSPELHNKYIRDADQRSSGKLKRTSQLVKFWRECRSPRIPIASFHLDLLLASQKVCDGVKSIAQCLSDGFRLLATRDCRALQDPLGISNFVSAVKTESQQDAARQAVAHAYDHVARALEAERYGKTLEARRQWNIVFNDKFPS
jgi:SMODS domain-containing protein